MTTTAVVTNLEEFRNRKRKKPADNSSIDARIERMKTSIRRIKELMEELRGAAKKGVDSSDNPCHTQAKPSGGKREENT